jgi:peptide/nickel transport system permease protein
MAGSRRLRLAGVGDELATYILQRLVAILPVLVGVSLIVFGLVALIPGDVASAMLGADATPAQVEELRRTLGLDRPLHEQYVRWLGRAVQGDLGQSIEMREPVGSLLVTRFQNTLILALTAMLFATGLGLVAGVVSATRQYSWIDRLTMLLALFGNSMPSFWLGIVLILVFSLGLGWFPASGMYSVRGDRGLGDLLQHLVLPAITLGTVSAAVVARMTRSSMLDVIRQDYVLTARAKGLRDQAVVYGHALRNALPPVVTVIGLQTGFLLGGAVLTETVFSWPGVGLQMYRAISSRDLPLIQGGVLMLATTFVLVNLLVDVLYAYLDPRVRLR